MFYMPTQLLAAYNVEKNHLCKSNTTFRIHDSTLYLLEGTRISPVPNISYREHAQGNPRVKRLNI